MGVQTLQHLMCFNYPGVTIALRKYCVTGIIHTYSYNSMVAIFVIISSTLFSQLDPGNWFTITASLSGLVVGVFSKHKMKTKLTFCQGNLLTHDFLGFKILFGGSPLNIYFKQGDVFKSSICLAVKLSSNGRNLGLEEEICSNSKRFFVLVEYSTIRKMEPLCIQQNLPPPI